MGKIIIADALTGLKSLSDESVDMCVTSPPYFNLRDYGVEGQIGNERTPDEYIFRLRSVFHEVKRVLKPNGTLWVVISDSYAGSGKGRNKDGSWKYNGGKQDTNTGSCIGTLYKTTAVGCKPKDLIGIPWLLAFALRDDGWYLRSDIIWDKSGNVFPESVKDRCTKAHEYIFMFSKSRTYYFDSEAIKEPLAKTAIKRIWDQKSDSRKENSGKADGKNKRDVWHVNTSSYKKAHFATFPPELIRPCILAGSRKGGVVLDPFIGSGTTAYVAKKEERDFIGIEIQTEYEALIYERLAEL